MPAMVTDLLNLPALPWLLVGAYLCGSIPFGLLLSKAFAKTDVRAAGSGNIGATNVARVAGKKLGVVTLALDALKGAVPVLVAGALTDDDVRPLAESTAGLLAFCGHCFPIWLRFKGGKGVATGAGVLLAHIPLIAGVGVLGFAATYAATRFVSAGSLVGAALITAGYLALRDVGAAALPLVAMLVILVLKHTGNIRRMLRREELRV